MNDSNIENHSQKGGKWWARVAHRIKALGATTQKDCVNISDQRALYVAWLRRNPEAIAYYFSEPYEHITNKQEKVERE